MRLLPLASYAISPNLTAKLLIAGALAGIFCLGGEAQQQRPQTPAKASRPLSLPAWVPVFPGATVEIDSGYRNTTSEMHFNVSTAAPCDRVVAFYQKQLTLAGLSIVNGFSTDGCAQQINSHDALGGRAVNLYFSTRIALSTPPKPVTEVSVEVVQRDEGRQNSAAVASIPAWVPPYPHAVPANVSAIQDGRQYSVSFLFNSRDDARTILSWYQDRLRQSGFAVTMDLTGSGGYLRSNTRDNSRALKIDISAADGQNVVSFGVREQR